MSIVGSHITLALLKQSFINEYLRQFSPIVRAFLHVSSLEDEQAYLEERLAKQEEGRTFFYCIFDNETHELVGAIEIRDPQEFKGQLYCWVNEDWWGSGAFQEALALSLKSYFKHTNKPGVTARVYTHNPRSYWALKKGGFSDLGFTVGPQGRQYELFYREK